jgi:hypothetical protein
MRTVWPSESEILSFCARLEAHCAFGICQRFDQNTSRLDLFSCGLPDPIRLSDVAVSFHSTVNRPPDRLTITRGGPTLRRWIHRGGILVIGVDLMQSARRRCSALVPMLPVVL